MDKLLSYLGDGYSFADLFAAITVIAAMFVCLEKTAQRLYRCFLGLYKKKKGQEEKGAAIDTNTIEIKKLSETINNLATLLNRQYAHLDKKIDEQKIRISLLDEEGKKRDCAILRDRILDGMRYFGRNKDAAGFIHISISEHENMNHLFEAYFDCGGNGTIQTMYDKEFKNWIIDR